MSFITLFFTSFASATLLPGGSEVLFVYLLAQNLNPSLLLLSASIGNTLGSFANYFIGKYAVTFALEREYISEKSFKKAELLFEKYGAWTLLFSWLPIIGDPLTLVAGCANYNQWKFFVIVGFSKMTRYIFIYGGFLAIY